MTKAHPAVTAIAARVAALYGIDVEIIFSRTRTKTIAEARAVCMWAARVRLGWSFPELGRAFGRDFTTVIYNCREVDVRRAIGTASKLMLSACELATLDGLASTEVSESDDSCPPSLDLSDVRGEGSEIARTA